MAVTNQCELGMKTRRCCALLWRAMALTQSAQRPGFEASVVLPTDAEREK